MKGLNFNRGVTGELSVLVWPVVGEYLPQQLFLDVVSQLITFFETFQLTVFNHILFRVEKMSYFQLVNSHDFICTHKTIRNLVWWTKRLHAVAFLLTE